MNHPNIATFSKVYHTSSSHFSKTVNYSPELQPAYLKKLKQLQDA